MFYYSQWRTWFLHVRDVSFTKHHKLFDIWKTYCSLQKRITSLAWIFQQLYYGVIPKNIPKQIWHLESNLIPLYCAKKGFQTGPSGQWYPSYSDRGEQRIPKAIYIFHQNWLKSANTTLVTLWAHCYFSSPVSRCEVTKPPLNPRTENDSVVEFPLQKSEDIPTLKNLDNVGERKNLHYKGQKRCLVHLHFISTVHCVLPFSVCCFQQNLIPCEHQRRYKLNTYQALTRPFKIP